LRHTLNHLLTVDWFYLDALEGGHRGYAVFDPEIPYPDLPGLAEAQAIADRRLIAFCDRLAEPDLDKTVELLRPEPVPPETIAAVLAHLFVHQIHHRGQAHAMLSGTGVAPPQLDEFFLVGDAGLREADLRALDMVDPVADADAIDVQLRDGRHVTVRTVREEDKDRFQDAVRSLSADSSYYRFFSPMRELTPKLLERATHPEPERELQLVAVAGGGPNEKIIGGARYVAISGTRDCEFSIAIVDEWQSFGLARPLLARLIEFARAHGFERMDGYILATNVRMLALARRFDFTEMPSEEGPTVRLVRRDLRAVPR
jgi:uncharacterized damage-inducible protein DinB/GNAT superfamily N-acetyltransferase